MTERKYMKDAPTSPYTIIFSIILSSVYFRFNSECQSFHLGYEHNSVGDAVSEE